MPANLSFDLLLARVEPDTRRTSHAPGTDSCHRNEVPQAVERGEARRR